MNLSNYRRRLSSFERLEERRLLAGDVYATSPVADVQQLAAMFAPQQVGEQDVFSQATKTGATKTGLV